MNKVTQIAQQEHPVQQLTTHLAIYTNTPLGVEVLRVISANFPCSWFKMSSRVKEREKKKKNNTNKMQLRHTIVVLDPKRWDLVFL